MHYHLQKEDWIGLALLTAMILALALLLVPVLFPAIHITNTEQYVVAIICTGLAIVCGIAMYRQHHDNNKVITKQQQLLILYATTTGTARQLATHVASFLEQKSSAHLSITVEDLQEYEFDNLPTGNILFIVSTNSGGTPPPSCSTFFSAVKDATVDFRYGSGTLSKLRFAVFGVGSKEYSSKEFCGAARELNKNLTKLGGHRFMQLGMGDDSQGDLFSQIDDWGGQVYATLIRPAVTTFDVIDSDDDVDDDGKNTGATEDAINMKLVEAEEPLLDDMEDLSALPEFDTQRVSSSAKDGIVAREMATPLQRKNLTKQGYKLIGSHSAVKLCRWTKSQLRGRGGCYKRTLYDIASYECMEATPSLACANKCTFCWRTHTNPVGREWRWKTDDPTFIVNEAITEHLKMIRSLAGMPGVIKERFDDACQRVRHCALSLVGEPIMYPRINELIRELHNRRISSFLVTNAQFPDAIRSLQPVTQLYCSVDAATKDALKAVDRPLFSDFWERFQDSLDALSQVKGRTVFRLTLIKDKNDSEDNLEGYGKLIARCRPDFVEIKGVTFCGKSNASDLRMTNVPWHHEVREFAARLAECVDSLSVGTASNVVDDGFKGYGLACEHAHSVCVLLARRDRFWHVETGKWRTWIDFEKFLQLEQEWRKTGRVFSSTEYCKETPDWALFGAQEEGFDPKETRFRKIRKGKGVQVQGGGGEDGGENEGC